MQSDAFCCQSYEVETQNRDYESVERGWAVLHHNILQQFETKKALKLRRHLLVSSSVVAILLFISFSLQLFAQTATGSISGTILDPSQAPVSGAVVTLTNIDTGQVRTAQTNNLGYYSFQLLPPAIYKFEVSASGFQRFVVDRVPLDVGSAVPENVSLQVGDVSQSVTVSETTAQVESESSSLGTVLGNTSIMDLPTNGRNSYGFAALVPGVRAPNLFTQVAYGNYNDQFLSINGSRANVSMFLLDGGWNSNSGFNGPGIYPPIDLVQEYKVQTSNLPAEFGNTAGGVINVVTKSGSNDVHGSLYEFVRNDDFDANNFYSNAAGQSRAPIRFNQFGGTFGGPVYIPKIYDGRNKTFFFVSYEALRWTRAYTTSGTLPTALQRSGDFSQTYNKAGQLISIYDPLSTVALPGGGYSRVPLSNNKMAASQINPVSAALIAYLPLPNTPGDPLTGANNFRSTLSAPTNENTFSLRGDQLVTQNQKIFVRWSQNWSTVDRPIVYGTASPNFSYSNPDNGTDLSHNIEGTVNYNWVANPTTVLELGSSVLHYWLGRSNAALGFDPTKLGLPSYFKNVGLTNCFPSISVSGMGTSINIPDTGGGFIGDCQYMNQSYDTFSEYGNVTKVHGAHTFKMGADWFDNRWSQRQTAASNGFSFGADMTQGPNPLAPSATSGFGWASFLFGTGDSGSIQSSSPGEFVSYHSYGFYFQDDWKISPKLTVNLGLRYDFNAPWTEKHNRINDWNGTGVVTVNGITLRGGLEFPGVNGVPRGQFQNNRTNFAPRAGFAYSVDEKTVLRGGFGIYYGPINGAAFAGNMSPYTGYSASTSWNANNGVQPVDLLSNPFPNGFTRAPDNRQGLLTLLGQNLNTMDRARLNLYAEQWNFGIERTLPGSFLASVAYAGSHGIHLYSPVNYDQMPDQYLSLGSALLNQVANPYYGLISSGPMSGPTVAQYWLLRPYPQFTGITAESNSYGNSIYHSLQAKLERRFSRGVGVLLSYTYSKLIDDVLPSDTYQGFPGENFSGGYIQDSTNRRADRSVANFDTPNYLAINGNWDLPFGKGRSFLSNGGWTSAVFGGWQLNGIFNMHTGAPLGLSVLTNTLYNNGAYGWSGAIEGNVQRPNYVGGNVYTSGSVASRVQEYFNVNAFALPAPFTYGNTGRLLPYLRGPGAIQLDMSLFKEIPVYERMHLQFRAEVFNLLNHPQFDNPNTVIGSPLAGVISNQVNSPRDIQLALKLLF